MNVIKDVQQYLSTLHEQNPHLLGEQSSCEHALQALLQHIQHSKGAQADEQLQHQRSSEQEMLIRQLSQLNQLIHGEQEPEHGLSQAARSSYQQQQSQLRDMQHQRQQHQAAAVAAVNNQQQVQAMLQHQIKLLELQQTQQGFHHPTGGPGSPPSTNLSTPDEAAYTFNSAPSQSAHQHYSQQQQQQQQPQKRRRGRPAASTTRVHPNLVYVRRFRERQKHMESELEATLAARKQQLQHLQAEQQQLCVKWEALEQVLQVQNNVLCLMQQLSMAEPPPVAAAAAAAAKELSGEQQQHEGAADAGGDVSMGERRKGAATDDAAAAQQRQRQKGKPQQEPPEEGEHMVCDPKPDSAGDVGGVHAAAPAPAGAAAGSARADGAQHALGNGSIHVKVESASLSPEPSAAATAARAAAAVAAAKAAVAKAAALRIPATAAAAAADPLQDQQLVLQQARHWLEPVKLYTLRAALMLEELGMLPQNVAAAAALEAARLCPEVAAKQTRSPQATAAAVAAAISAAAAEAKPAAAATAAAAVAAAVRSAWDGSGGAAAAGVGNGEVIEGVPLVRYPYSIGMYVITPDPIKNVCWPMNMSCWQVDDGNNQQHAEQAGRAMWAVLSPERWRLLKATWLTMSNQLQQVQQDFVRLHGLLCTIGQRCQPCEGSTSGRTGQASTSSSSAHSSPATAALGLAAAAVGVAGSQQQQQQRGTIGVLANGTSSSSGQLQKPRGLCKDGFASMEDSTAYEYAAVAVQVENVLLREDAISFQLCGAFLELLDPLELAVGYVSSWPYHPQAFTILDVIFKLGEPPQEVTGMLQ